MATPAAKHSPLDRDTPRGLILCCVTGPFLPGTCWRTPMYRLTVALAWAIAGRGARPFRCLPDHLARTHGVSRLGSAM